jgi:rod shape determining protein RodA
VAAAQFLAAGLISMQAMAGRRPMVHARTIWRHFDLLHFLSMMLLVAIGVVMVYSSFDVALPDDTPFLMRAAMRQVLFALLGLGVYLFAAAIDYQVLDALSLWLYVPMLALLAITLTIGRTDFGATSRLDTGEYFDVQTSELAKVVMILLLARYLGRDREALESPRPFLLSMLLLLPPLALIYTQPDFGQTFMLLATWLGMAFLGGVRWRHMLLLVVIGLLVAPVIWFRAEPFMRGRIITFLFPGDDPSGASYNVNQALISIGSGGWLGKGLLRGTQSQLHFLRVRHTDFIFSVLAEEMGFLGALLLLSLYAILIMRLVRIAMTTPDMYGRLVVVGVTCMLFFQTVINMGFNVNLLPVTGLPLPLVSYGGSSLVTMMLALGLTQSVAMRSKPIENDLLS